MAALRTKVEELDRLLCHYLAKIGQSLSLCASAKELAYLIDKCIKFWCRVAQDYQRFSSGLEMEE
jgi:hypothetical protein